MKVEDFFRYIQGELLSCPESLMEIEIMRTAIELCEKTHAWVETQDPIKLIDGQAEYDVDYPSNSRVIAALMVSMDSGRRLAAADQAWLESHLSNWPVATSVEPLYFSAPVQRDVIQVYPVPQLPTGSITIKGTYAPTMKSATFPDVLFNDYFDALTAGSKYRLMAKAGQQWANLPMATVYKAEYERKLNDARIEVLHDRVPSTLSVRPRKFQ